MKRRGRTIAFSTLALGLVVLVVAGIISKNRILEEWYLHVLETATLEDQREAAWKLAEMGSIRVLPLLIQLVKDPHYTSSLKHRGIVSIHKMGLHAVPILAQELKGDPIPWKRIHELLAKEPTTQPEQCILRFYRLENVLPKFRGLGKGPRISLDELDDGVGFPTAEASRRESYYNAINDVLHSEWGDGIVDGTSGRSALVLSPYFCVRAPEDVQREIEDALRDEVTFPFHLVFDPEWLDERDVPLLIGLLKEKTVSPFWRRCVFCVLDSIRSRLGDPVMTALKTACSEGDEAFCQAATEALKKIQGTQDETQG